MNKKIKNLIAILIIALISLTGCNIQKNLDSYPIDINLATKYFEELQNISKEDNCKLWGCELYGPLMFIDNKTKFTVANQNPGKIFKKHGDVYIGYLPKNMVIANTATEINGKLWTTLLWSSVSKNEYKRNLLLFHELYHSIQKKIGLDGKYVGSPHLNTKKGRILIQLEWQALKSAIKDSGNKKIEDIQSALIFRNFRRELFKDSTQIENQMEMKEGLAEYTGLKMCGRNNKEILEYLCSTLDKAKDKYPSFVNSFAYVSGPPYGILLDQSGKDWHNLYRKYGDFGIVLKNVYNIQIPDDLKEEAEKRSNQYNGVNITKAENQREKERNKQIVKYKKMFLSEPTIKLPLKGMMNIAYHPYYVQPLENYGTVYSNTAIASGDWGKVTISSSALLSPDKKTLSLSALNLNKENTNKTSIKGNGWLLELNKNWHLLLDKNGNGTVKKR